MVESPEMSLLAAIRRSGSLVERGIVTANEFTNKVFHELAHIDRVYPEIIITLWESVPVSIRRKFTAPLRKAALPEFRWHPFYIGGQQMTEEEVSRGTARIREWAMEIVRFLDGDLSGTHSKSAPVRL